jgi:hypothetical protein
MMKLTQYLNDSTFLYHLFLWKIVKVFTVQVAPHL